MKVCTKCKVTKALSEFSPRPDRPCGILSKCKQCNRDLVALYRKANPEKVLTYTKRRQAESPEKIRCSTAKYRANNPGKGLAYDRKRRAENGDALRARAVELYAINRASISERRARCRQLSVEKVRAKEKANRIANLDKRREKERRAGERFRATIKGKLENRIRVGMLRGLIKGSKLGRKTFDLLGFDVNDLKTHLEALFLPGMSWENFGPVWHIDHRVPLSAHNYETPDHLDFKRAWALSNLQPLWSEVNLSKGARLNAPFQPSLAI